MNWSPLLITRLFDAAAAASPTMSPKVADLFEDHDRMLTVSR